MSKKQVTIAKEVQRIDRKIRKSKFQCLYRSCHEYSINSHFIQRNGILSQIAIDNHFIELKQKDFFKIRKKEPFLEFKKVGIKDGFSLPIFCKKHDSNIFSPIETREINFEKHESQLLVSYRTICAELRKKEIETFRFQQILDSPILQDLMDEEIMTQFDSMIFGYQMGCKELDDYRTVFEQEITENKGRFLFRTYKFEKKELCVSTLFSPDSGMDQGPLGLIQPQENVIINIFPYKDESIVIVGYLKDLTNDWIINYTESWVEMNDTEFGKELTHLICLRTETWALSPNLFEQLNEEDVMKMNRIITENSHNHNFKMSTDFNLFNH